MHGDDLPPPGLYHRLLKELERPLFQECLQATNGNQIKTAELLGLNRNTVRKKLRDLEIDVVRGLARQRNAKGRVSNASLEFGYRPVVAIYWRSLCFTI